MPNHLLRGATAGFASHSGETWRADIDGLRAVAVLSVIAFHAFPSLLPGGFLGVDIFFVISGFLITGILLEGQASGRFSILQFYERRARRIFPALVVVLLATLIATSLLTPLHSSLQTAKHGVAGALSLANVVFWSEAGYFDTASHAKPLLHLWSLGVEEQFYIAWPLLVAALAGRPKLFLVTAIALCVASFAATIWLNTLDSNLVFYLPMFRAWELGLGALVAMAVHFGHGPGDAGRRYSAVLQAVSLVTIAATLLLFDASQPVPGIGIVPCLAATAALLWIGAGSSARATAVSTVLTNKPMV